MFALQLPAVTEESPRAAVELAKKLSASGVKMFGAFWCTHCYDQKQLFGKQAMEYFPYVECYPEGYRKVCFQLLKTASLYCGIAGISSTVQCCAEMEHLIWHFPSQKHLLLQYFFGFLPPVTINKCLQPDFV